MNFPSRTLLLVCWVVGRGLNFFFKSLLPPVGEQSSALPPQAGMQSSKCTRSGCRKGITHELAISEAAGSDSRGNPVISRWREHGFELPVVKDGYFLRNTLN